MTEYPKPCADCGRLMRPGKATKKNYPTSEIMHCARGLCKTCYGKHGTIGYERQDPAFAQLRHENNMAGLNRFMQARYERIIRARRSRL